MADLILNLARSETLERPVNRVFPDGAPQNNAEVKRIAERYFDLKAGRLNGYTVTRADNGNILIRPEPTFGEMPELESPVEFPSTYEEFRTEANNILKDLFDTQNEVLGLAQEVIGVYEGLASGDGDQRATVEVNLNPSSFATTASLVFMMILPWVLAIFLLIRLIDVTPR